MKLNVSSKNEFKFFPVVGNNLELPEDERFSVILRKVNLAITGKWTKYDATGAMNIDLKEKLRAHIVRFENAPTLSDENGIEKNLTVDILLSDTYPELFDIVDQIIQEVYKIISEGNIEVKK